MTKRYLSPQGKTIDRTLETVPATCGIEGIADEGTPIYDSNGSTLDWNGQTQAKRDGKALFLCEDGFEWTFDQLVAATDDA